MGREKGGSLFIRTPIARLTGHVPRDCSAQERLRGRLKGSFGILAMHPRSSSATKGLETGLIGRSQASMHFEICIWKRAASGLYLSALPQQKQCGEFCS